MQSYRYLLESVLLDFSRSVENQNYSKFLNSKKLLMQIDLNQVLIMAGFRFPKQNLSFDRRNIGRAVSDVLTQAKRECRLICGLLPAIAYLEKNPDDVLFCFLPETNPEDAATHMQTVLLQAFCYENYIPVIQVRILQSTIT